MAGRFNRTLGAAGVALLALAGPVAADGYEGGMKDAAPAEEGRKFSWSFNIGGTSDYVFRGVSQSDEDPAFQAGIDASYGIFYIGAWGSGIDFEDTADEVAEIDLYGGIKPTWGKVTFDLGVIYYWYPGTFNNPEADYVELKAGYSYAWTDSFSSGTTVYWTPDNTLETGELWTIESTAAYTLPAWRIFTPTISGVIGFQYAENDIFGVNEDEFTYWNAGLALAVEKFTFDFRYWDTDGSSAFCEGAFLQCDERFVFTAKVTLP